MQAMVRIKIVILCLFAAVSAMGTVDMTERVARLRAEADSLHGVGRTDSALIIGEEAMALARDCGDRLQIVGTLSAQGVFLRSSGRVGEALECYGKALEIVTTEEFRRNPGQEAVEEAATLYVNLATLDVDMAQKDEAVRHASAAAEWGAKSGDPAFRSQLYGAVGSVFAACGEFDKALRYQASGYDDALAAGDAESALRAAAYGMMFSDRAGNGADTGMWRGRCRELLSMVESMMARLTYLQGECVIALNHGDWRGSIPFFRQILSMEGIDGLPFVKYDCYNNLHDAYAHLGDYREAYGVLLEANALRDSLMEREKAESLRELTVKYETKETELALARSEAGRVRTLMWLAAAVSLLLAMAVILVAYRSRQRRRRMRSEMEFAALKADVGRQYAEGLEAERSRMSRELHDGVCNDLLAIECGMGRGTLSGQDATEMIGRCRESVRRISHELMPPEFGYATLEEVVRFFVAKQAEGCEGRIDLSFESASGAPWGDVPDSVALEVYRVAQEAVSNAVRHSGASSVRVRLSLADGTVELTVTDNGTWPSGSRRGAGLGSMARRAAAIGGRLTSTTGDDGTTVRLRARL